MDFPKYNFDNMTEADVREEIVAPLLRHLGYRSGTENNVIREQTLSYPKRFLGHKKETDPILRGRADYICEAYSKVRWIIEAKSPDADLDREVEEQSWSYANHPEIRAVFFCLTNGRDFKIYQTNKGPESEAVFKCSYDEMNSSLTIIESILSPDSMLRDHPGYVVDTGIPIGPGLRSMVRITNGSICYQKISTDFPPFIGLMMSITGGSVEHNEFGKLEAYIETLVPFQSLQKLNEKLGLSNLYLSSENSAVSINPNNPTLFTAITNHILPQGERVLNFSTGEEIQLLTNIHVQTKTVVSGYLEGKVFHGDFNALLIYHEKKMTVSLEGDFRVHLA